MRIYDFGCTACGGTFEAFVRSEGDVPPCKQCGSTDVARRQVSQVAIRTRKNRRGRVVDLSSNACPCVGHKHPHS